MGENASAQAQTRVVELSINFRYLINERPVQCTVRDPAVRGLAVPRMGQSFRESKISFSYRIHGQTEIAQKHEFVYKSNANCVFSQNS